MRNPVLIAAFALLSLGRLTGFLTEPALRAANIHTILGRPAAVSVPAVLPDRLVVVSWNIERGVRFAGVLDTLKTLNADVLLLQEVDRHCDRSDGRDVAADLAAALGMNWIFAGEFQEIGEGTEGSRGAARPGDPESISDYRRRASWSLPSRPACAGG